MTVQQALVQNAEELRRQVKEHQDLLARMMGQNDVEVEIDPCLFLDCPHKRKLRETLAETIAVLEETRKAFKSKRLEALRKKLIGVLAKDA